MERIVYYALSILFTLSIGACAKKDLPIVDEESGKETEVVFQLSILKGDQQVALPRAVLYDTLVVQLTDKENKPVSGRQIRFKPVSTDVTSSSWEVTTDDQGIARTRITLGNIRPGDYEEIVSVFLKSDERVKVGLSAKVVERTEIDTWLAQHSQIADAISWPESSTLNRSYSDWSATQKTALYHHYQQAKTGWNREVSDAYIPKNQYHGSSVLVELLEQDAWAIYLSNIAVSLHLEIENLLGWSLLDYDDSELQMLLDGSVFFLRSGTVYRLNTPHVSRYVLPESALFLRSFLQQKKIIQTDRLSTIVALLEWCHVNLNHFLGGYENDNIDNHWQYRGATPISRMINGTTRQTDSRFGRYTAGCHGTVDFLKIVLRSVNIPVVSMWGMDGSGHRQAWFMSEDLYMAHGDDPYNGHSWVTPRVSMGELLVDKATMEEWFTGPIKKSVAQAVATFAINHLSNILVNIRASEPAGTPPEQSQVLERMKTFFTLEELIEKDLWTRLDAKIEALGGRDRIPEALIGRYR